MKAKSIIVTGGAGLIGQTIVQDCLRNNYIVHVLDLKFGDKIKKIKDQNTKNCILHTCDITNYQKLKNIILEISCLDENVIGAIHSAYPRTKTWGQKIGDIEDHRIIEHINMQLGGAILFSKYVIELLKKDGGGCLIHLSSIYGIRAPKFEMYKDTEMHTPVEYAAVKGGIINMTKWLAKYYKGNQIRVNCISPGGIYDKQPENFIEAYNKHATNIGMLDPVMIANICTFLLSEKAYGINGENIVVDDGWSL